MGHHTEMRTKLDIRAMSCDSTLPQFATLGPNKQQNPVRSDMAVINWGHHMSVG